MRLLVFVVLLALAAAPCTAAVQGTSGLPMGSALTDGGGWVEGGFYSGVNGDFMMDSASPGGTPDSYTFTVSSIPVTLRITDLYVTGDRWTVYITGAEAHTFSTPVVTDNVAASWTNDPDTAWADPAFSKASIVLSTAGAYTVDLHEDHYPVGYLDGEVVARIDAVPEPGTLALLAVGAGGLLPFWRRRTKR